VGWPSALFRPDDSVGADHPHAAGGFALAVLSPATCLLAVAAIFAVPALASLAHRAMRDRIA
jgi:hypothetical protein